MEILTTVLLILATVVVGLALIGQGMKLLRSLKRSVNEGNS